jgi:hypothetical protein
MIFWHTKSKGNTTKNLVLIVNTLHPVCLLSLFFSVIIIISTEDYISPKDATCSTEQKKEDMACLSINLREATVGNRVIDNDVAFRFVKLV